MVAIMIITVLDTAELARLQDGRYQAIIWRVYRGFCRIMENRMETSI